MTDDNEDETGTKPGTRPHHEGGAGDVASPTPRGGDVTGAPIHRCEHCGQALPPLLRYVAAVRANPEASARDLMRRLGYTSPRSITKLAEQAERAGLGKRVNGKMRLNNA